MLWSEDSEYPQRDWRRAVVDLDTLRGYESWVREQKGIFGTPLFGVSDIAKHLGVTPGAVCNWRARAADTVPAQYVTLAGIPYWNGRGMRAWEVWRAGRTWPE